MSTSLFFSDQLTTKAKIKIISYNVNLPYILLYLYILQVSQFQLKIEYEHSAAEGLVINR